MSEVTDTPPVFDEPDLGELQRRRKRLTLAVTVGVLAVAGAAVAGGLKYSDVQTRARIDDAFAAFSTCALGADALEPGERPSVRFRRQQLRAIAVPKDKRGKVGETAWPMSCAPVAHKFAESLREAGRSKADDGLSAQTEKLAALLKDEKSIKNDLSTLVERVWSGLAAEGVKAGKPSGEPPPKAEAPMDVASTKRVPPVFERSFALASVHPAAFATEDLQVVVDQKDVKRAPALCASPSGSAQLACTTLGDAVAKATPGLRLVGTSEPGAPAYVYAGDRGAAGVFPVGVKGETGPARTQMTYGGYAERDGALTLLGWDNDAKEVVMTRDAPGKKGAPVPVLSAKTIGNPYYGVALLWDQLIWKAFDKQNRLTLYARPVKRAADEAATVAVGELPELGFIEGVDEDLHVAGCRTREALVARVKGTRTQQLAFKLGDKWLPPVLAETLGGAVSCRGAEVTITRVSGVVDGEQFLPLVNVHRCSSAGCATKRVDMRAVLGANTEVAPPTDKDFAAVDVGGSLIVVWRAGNLGGVRMRVAPAERIDTTPDRVIYDDMLDDSAAELAVASVSSFFEMKLLPRAEDAVLLLSTKAGVHAFRVDASGKLEPMTVEW